MKMKYVSIIYALVLLVEGGRVVLWGGESSIGNKSDQLTSVITIYTTQCAFAATTEDNGLVT